ncbi:MAG: GIY-YIG nuclease family protein [Ignavibacteriaceae bacterium]|nr:GIY-YIG nuclease family protein [Ignavibacteriaceae bacterium]
MSFFTYILYSEKLDKFYVGHTNNLIRRFNEHNSFQSSSTKSGVPWKLVFSKEYSTNSESIKMELKIKTMKSRKFIEGLVAKG